MLLSVFIVNVFLFVCFVKKDINSLQRPQVARKSLTADSGKKKTNRLLLGLIEKSTFIAEITLVRIGFKEV